jgi:hypothetical protein
MNCPKEKKKSMKFEYRKGRGDMMNETGEAKKGKTIRHNLPRPAKSCRGTARRAHRRRADDTPGDAKKNPVG